MKQKRYMRRQDVERCNKILLENLENAYSKTTLPQSLALELLKTLNKGFQQLDEMPASDEEEISPDLVMTPQEAREFIFEIARKTLKI
jgi:hypothetical protein